MTSLSWDTLRDEIFLGRGMRKRLHPGLVMVTFEEVWIQGILGSGPVLEKELYEDEEEDLGHVCT